MKITFLLDEDFINYKKPSMFIGIPFCDGKCNIDAGKIVCQNNNLDDSKDIEIKYIIDRYLKNPITQAIVIGGREPLFKSYLDIIELISELRKHCDDDCIIYTGYTEDEIKDRVEILKQYRNIIVKFGRFIPNQKKHYDEVLGVELASDNQYAKKIS